MAAWLPPYGFVCKVISMNLNIGGTYKMSFTNFTTGNSHSFVGEFTRIMRFKDLSSPEFPVAENDANKIMHIALPIGKNI